MRLIPLLENDRLPNLLLDARVDPVVLAFTLVISVATGVLFGIAPALSAAPVRVQETLGKAAVPATAVAVSGCGARWWSPRRRWP